ncbi:MAG: hypothetical protein ACI8T1_001712 [Verrucomicrobiales bacterium]|jgi:hypothetical protein
MNIPAIKGVIRRRILLNYRVAPDVVTRILPANFRPKIIDGYAIVGICLIRLEEIRPKGFPSFVGISSENSAHRIAVEWENAEGQSQEGVFVPRRDTDSRLNSLAGGRVFPGVHHHSKFSVCDRGGKITVRVDAPDIDSPLVEIEAEESDDFSKSSVFESLEESSRFFEAGGIGYSSRPDSCLMDGLLLKVPVWRVSSLAVHHVRSAFYDDASVFPAGSIELDHALLMRDIPHEWHSEPSMTAIKQPGTSR